LDYLHKFETPVLKAPAHLFKKTRSSTVFAKNHIQCTNSPNIRSKSARLRLDEKVHSNIKTADTQNRTKLIMNHFSFLLTESSIKHTLL